MCHPFPPPPPPPPLIFHFGFIVVHQQHQAETISSSSPFLDGSCLCSAKNKAAHYLHLNQKPTALSYLRSKKQLEQELQKRIGAAEQLKTIIRSIDGAHGDIEVSFGRYSCILYSASLVDLNQVPVSLC